MVWRVFPWDRAAPGGAPFSARSVAPAHKQNYGRFDLHGRPLVLYLAETPAHAVAEVLRGLKRSPADPFDPKRHRVTADDLVGAGGHPRALVPVQLPEHIADRLPDLADGGALQHFGVRADELSSSDRRISQQAARRIYEHADQVPGFLWWSAFGGDWHAALLFLDRALLEEIDFGEPEILTLDQEAVQEAARVLNLDI